ncbi:MAG: site-2 protease family protein, partial [Porphyromonas sp.]
TAFLSIILAVMNILPIPALDGGHILFIIIEIIRRKPLSDRAMTTIQTVGLVLLLLLMLYANGNDIYRSFFGH